ncbi:hypothetical protein PTTG_28087 [Puccinia triticina 1-1 BBBD Race 1]|uniref:Uncharacterized protein n=1 Tax=Puccinia triticina (isolate 1-1 / race 1 (BBBD)) TaxID=630390 RepID=A0A180GES3_PUCT1|nr:hypothetical protein PTTG_28087 [Puccinia triticina 1-1 BBBD Race 1]
MLGTGALWEAPTKSAASSTRATSCFNDWASGVPANIVQNPTWTPMPEANWATSNLHADKVTDSDGDVSMSNSDRVPSPDVPGEYRLANYPFLKESQIVLLLDQDALEAPDADPIN